MRAKGERSNSIELGDNAASSFQILLNGGEQNMQYDLSLSSLLYRKDLYNP